MSYFNAALSCEQVVKAYCVDRYIVVQRLDSRAFTMLCVQFFVRCAEQTQLSRVYSHVAANANRLRQASGVCVGRPSCLVGG